MSYSPHNIHAKMYSKPSEKIARVDQHTHSADNGRSVRQQLLVFFLNTLHLRIPGLKTPPQQLMKPKHSGLGLSAHESVQATLDNYV